jgi:hypothetical protein
MRSIFALSAAMSVLCLQPAYATTLVVSNNTDISNGNVSNPTALIASPGSDGISLTEAVQAVHGAPGPHTITFAPALAGQTIALTGGLSLRQDDVALLGLTDADGNPAVTIDATNAGAVAFDVHASNVSIAHIGFVKARQVFTISIRAGNTSVPGPQRIDNITISNNVFDNSAFPNSHCIAVSLGMEAQASNADFGNVSITRNAFANYTGEADGIHIQAGGTNNVIHDVVISENSFRNVTGPIEPVFAGPASGNRITGLRIVGNSFAESTQVIAISAIGNDGQPAERNVIDGTSIANNSFSNSSVVGVSLLGGLRNTTGNAVTNTTIVNNTITASGQAVLLTGAMGNDGRPGVGVNNVVNSTRVAGNTFSNNSGAGVALYGATSGTSNAVTNTTIANNTFRASAQAVSITGGSGIDAAPAATGNVVDATLVTGNTFADNGGAAVGLNGGVTNATNNAVTNTTIVNNLIYGTTTFGGIAIVAARKGGRLNRNIGVSIINNTIAGNVGGGVLVNDDPNHTGGNNTSSGIVVLNSIVVGNLSSFDSSPRDFAGLDASQVSYSLVGQSGFAGGTGNSSGDPKFVNPSQGDFRLQAGSPAIDAANSIGAPLTDLEGRRRIDDPGSPNRGVGPVPYVDIGASEFGSAPAAPPTVSVTASGPITKRTLALSVTPPASVQSPMGSVFVVAVLPPAQGSRVYAMSANGGWGTVASCDAAPDAYSGPLRAGLQIPVTSDADLSQVQGAVIQVGYGIGPTAAAACTDMLNYATIKAVYTIN